MIYNKHNNYSDQEKAQLHYCDTQCVGLDYCGGSDMYGYPCPLSPPKEVIRQEIRASILFSKSERS